jgi:hypothetical protein
MDCRSLAAGDSRSGPGPGPGPGPVVVGLYLRAWLRGLSSPRWPLLLGWALLALVLGRWPPVAAAMRSDRVRELRQETVDMFYHGFDNYMKIAFPEDEVCFESPAGHTISRANPLTILLAPPGVLHSPYSRRQESPKCRAQRRPGELLLDPYR